MGWLIILAAAAEIALADTAVGDRASVWRWTDESGAVHITGRLADVPEAYRRRAAPMSFSTVAEPPSAPSPKSEPLDGGALLRFDLAEGMISVASVFNESTERGAWIDTGSELTIITTKLATALGVDVRGAEKRTFHTPKGPVTAPVTVLKSVRVGPARANGVPAAIMDFPGRGPVSAVIGMNFLSLFPFEINMKDRTLVFGSGASDERSGGGRNQSPASLKNAEDK